MAKYQLKFKTIKFSLLGVFINFSAFSGMKECRLIMLVQCGRWRGDSSRCGGSLSKIKEMQVYLL